MRIATAGVVLFLTLATTAGAQSSVVRVFITDNLASMTDNLALGAGQSGWGVADGGGASRSGPSGSFAGRGECRGLVVTSQPWRAHFTISTPRNLGGDDLLDFDLGSGNLVAVFDGWGDMLYAGSTRQFGNALKDACEAIDRHLGRGAELITIGEARGR